jgi:hypothetical protein
MLFARGGLIRALDFYHFQREVQVLFYLRNNVLYMQYIYAIY